MNWNRYAERAMWNYYKKPVKRPTPKALAPARGSAARLEKLLDAAFGVLAHDCDPLDHGSIKQRQSLKEKFAKIMRVRQNN